jgi:TolB protein
MGTGMRRIAQVALLLLCALWPRSAGAQAEVFLEVHKGEVFRIPVVLEDLTWDAMDPVIFQGRERAEDILTQDLVFSDAFIVIRASLAEQPADDLRLDVSGLPVDRAPQARLRGAVRRRRDDLVLDATLLDEGTGQTILSRRYTLGWDPQRLEADRWGLHRLADDVTLYLTGIAFVRAAGEARELWGIDWDGAAAGRLVGLGSLLLSPAWHPEGERLAFTSYHLGPPALVALDLVSSRITMLCDWETPGAPAFAPDGRRLAFSSTREGNAEIYVARADGSGARRLTHSPGIDTSPSWSPSGREIVFTSDRSGHPQLYIMKADGTEVRRLTYGGRWNDSPDWSPRDDRIVHVCQVDGAFELALIQADGGGWVLLTEGGGCENPRFAPDGRHVVFARAQGGRRGLWVIDVDSGRVRQLTRFNRDSYNPAWSHPTEDRLGSAFREEGSLR